MAPLSSIPQPSSKSVDRFFVSRGLGGQDNNFDILQSYFKEMQKATVETLIPDDLTTFASCAHFFGVIMFEAGEDFGDEDAEGEPEEDSEEVLMDAGNTTPPPTDVSKADDDKKDEPTVKEEDEDPMIAYEAIPEEGILKWREAFMAKLHEDHEDLPNSVVYDEFETESNEDFVRIPSPFRETSSPISDISCDDASSPLDDFIIWPDDSLSVVGSEGTKFGLQGPPLTDESYSIPGSVSKFSIGPVVVDKEFGHDYLEPIRYTSPEPRPVEIEDEEFKKMNREGAIRMRDQLWATRVAEYEKSKRAKKEKARAPQVPIPAIQPLPLPHLGRKDLMPAGLVYLWTSQNLDDPLHMGEYNIGFYITPAYRNHANLAHGLNCAVKLAFDDPQCHRLQSIVVENDDKLYALELLATTGFRQEGIRRRAFFSSITNEWKDITYCAMLATEWIYDTNSDSTVRIRSKSLWDEILSRHQRERDDFVRLQEKTTLKRASSVETIREKINTSINLGADPVTPITDTDDNSAFSNVSAKRRRVEPVIVRPFGSIRGGSVTSQVDVNFENKTSPTAGPSKTRKRPVSGLSHRSQASSITMSSQWSVLGNSRR